MPQKLSNRMHNFNILLAPRGIDSPTRSGLMRFVLLTFALVGVFTLHAFILGNTRVSASVQSQLTVAAVNRLKLARQGETIELTAKDLAPLVEKDLNKLHVLD